jgi:hemoglobin
MTLYDDIGGAPAVRAALDAFYPRVLADPKLIPFFEGVDIERLKGIQEGFFALALGGPDNYKGRSLVDAHAKSRQRGMDDGSFDHFLSVFRGVLVDLEVPAEKIGELLTVFEGARAQVLNR